MHQHGRQAVSSWYTQSGIASRGVRNLLIGYARACASAPTGHTCGSLCSKDRDDGYRRAAVHPFHHPTPATPANPAAAAWSVYCPLTLGQYDTALWSGAAGFAREHGLKLLTVVGGGLHGTGAGREPQRNVLYELSEAGQFDGLVIVGHIGHDLMPEAFRTFCERYRPLPMAMTASATSRVSPSVVVDNTVGLRAAITHLDRGPRLSAHCLRARLRW